jgi:hypothetical protein
MAGRGPAPKNPATRQRNNKKPTAAVLVGNPKAKVPELPKLPEPVDEPGAPPVLREWHPQTKLEWRAIHRSPMASQFIDTDEAGVVKLIVLIDDFWKASSPTARKELSVEIRLQRLEFGLTPVARSRMQWEIERGAEAQAKAAKRAKPRRGAARPDPRDALGAQSPPALKVVGSKRSA